ncbi:MAG: cytochrome c [Phyllobacteriaceae bacterium]|nr:cytochrome c [Phyllobacteriaceae bacterium]
MRRGIGWLTAIGCLATIAGPARAEDAAVTEGRRIAHGACSPCHAVGPTGASPRAEAPPFRDLGHKYPVENLEEALAEGVVVGHPGMPEVKMNEREIAAFVAWLKTVQMP